MKTISKESVLKVLRKEMCLGLSRLAARHGVDANNETLARTVNDLERHGKIHRVAGKGRHASFVLATFE